MKIFPLERPRSHAAWAAAGACAWWVLLYLIVDRAKDTGSGLLTMLWFVWQFFGIAAVPYALRRLDEAIASSRGDHRPLHRPYFTSAGAFVGSIAGVVALIVALVASDLKLPALGGDVVIVPVMALGAWLGARIAAGRGAEGAVSIGYDALSYRHGRRTTVVALRDVTEVRGAAGEVVVQRRGGPALAIDLRGTEADGRALEAAIERAARAAREALPGGVALRREERDVGAWRDALRAKAMGGTDFRAQALDRDDLEAALVHPGATAEERIGAALALRELDDAGATRVRVAAESAVDPGLREVLRAVADGSADEAAVREAARG